MNSTIASDLRGFGPIGISVIFLILFTGNIFIGKLIIPLGAILVLLWMYWSQTPWKEIGYVKSNQWFRIIVFGILGGITFKIFLKALIMPLLGAPSINQNYHYLAGNTSQLPFAIWAMLVAGFAEETVFRGFMFERINKLLGNGIRTKLVAILITSLLFGLSHYINQGKWGVLQGTIFGLVFASFYALRPHIWSLMIAHASFDLTALYMIYNDLESRVAHLFFN
ncbi:MAG: type II CAAX endopeptidase family protein [Saprospiraceae bacterium]